MNKLWGTICLQVILLMATAGWLGCGQPPKTNYRFYYYPAFNTYYDVAGGAFVYTVDGGQNWFHKKADSAALPPTLGQKIMIESAVANAWVQNDAHRAQYGGTLSNYRHLDQLSNEDLQGLFAVARVPADTISQQKAAVSASPAATDTKALKKKGSSKFFKRLKEGFKKFKEDLSGKNKK